MAFVSRADRKLHDINSNTLGPGSYINPTSYSANPSFAPFASTADRKFFKLGQSQTPGPGSYNPISASAPQLIDQYGNTKFSSSFANQNPRLPYPSGAQLPGPGSYNPRDTWKASKKYSKNLNSSSWTRVPSAPSIPAGHQTFGYDETSTGELIMQKNPEKTYSGTQNDSIGPGHYLIQDDRTEKGPKWHKSSSKRALSQYDTTGPDLGPGCYSEDQLKTGPLYKYKQNAVFLSRFKEDHLEVKDKNPLGPGQYNISKSTTRPRPAKYQNFGSSSKRFCHKRGESELGPGHYSYPEPQKEKAGSTVPFASNNSRFHYSSSSTPGPGYYKKTDLVEDLSKKTWGKQGVFGSSEKRFVHKRNEKTPGPGHYPETDKRIGSYSCVHEKPHAVFLSKSNRGNSTKPVAPPPGSYEAKSAFKPVQKKANSMHPVLSKVTRCSSEMDLAFASRAERFDLKKAKKTSAVPGPGSYDLKTRKPAKKVIIAQEERFKHKNVSGPGPWSYTEDPDKWIRKSFNILFSDVEHD